MRENNFRPKHIRPFLPLPPPLSLPPRKNRRWVDITPKTNTTGTWVEDTTLQQIQQAHGVRTILYSKYNRYGGIGNSPSINTTDLRIGNSTLHQIQIAKPNSLSLISLFHVTFDTNRKQGSDTSRCGRRRLGYPAPTPHPTLPLPPPSPRPRCSSKINS